MLRLFIETSNLDFQVALHDGESLIYRSDRRAQDDVPGLSELLQEALAETQLTAPDLQEIVVDVGPGGLTSTRSGIAFANGLAFALDVEIVEANALELMVLQTPASDRQHVIAARRSNDGNYFMGFYLGQECQKLALGKPEVLIAELGWKNEELRWIGPYPKQWPLDPPNLDVEYVDLLSPGLEAFATLSQLKEFSSRPRVKAAGPINEVIR